MVRTRIGRRKNKSMFDAHFFFFVSSIFPIVKVECRSSVAQPPSLSLTSLLPLSDHGRALQGARHPRARRGAVSLGCYLFHLRSMRSLSFRRSRPRPQPRASKKQTRLNSYNRPEEDFASREEFDDYLEQREDLSKLKVVSRFFFFCFPLVHLLTLELPSSFYFSSSSSSFSAFKVFNLTEGIDVAECEAKLTKYAAENASSIAAHASAAAERARLAEKAEGAAAREGGGGEQPEATTTATATGTTAAAPPPMFNQPPPMPLGLPPEPITSAAAVGDATMADAAATTAATTETTGVVPFAASGGAPKTPQDYLRMGAASGWDAKGARRRGIAEAFRSLFAF